MKEITGTIQAINTDHLMRLFIGNQEICSAEDFRKAIDNQTLLQDRVNELRRLLESIIKTTHSSLDGRSYLAELHPRHTLDIKKRVDSKETWYEGDWLSNLYDAIKAAEAAL